MSTPLHELPDWVPQFLALLRGNGLITRSAKACGVSTIAVARLRERSEDFDAAVEDALEEAVDTLEEEAWRRARDGVKKNIYYKGSLVDTVQEYSDSLLQFLLKGRRREVYGDKQELTGPGGGPLLITDDTARAARIASLIDLAKRRSEESLKLFSNPDSTSDPDIESLL